MDPASLRAAIAGICTQDHRRATVPTAQDTEQLSGGRGLCRATVLGSVSRPNGIQSAGASVQSCSAVPSLSDALAHNRPRRNHHPGARFGLGFGFKPCCQFRYFDAAYRCVLDPQKVVKIVRDALTARRPARCRAVGLTLHRAQFGRQASR